MVGWSRARSVALGAVSLAALLATLPAHALDSPRAVDECADTARTLASEPGEPIGDEVEANLRDLHARFDGLPGFVDVYHHGGTDYRPTFIADVPAAAEDVDTPIPVTFETWPEAPTPMGPGAAPDADDTLCNGIRPGDAFNGSCTLGFVMTSGDTTYIATAGHCGNVGREVLSPGIGRVGVITHSVNGGVGNDFALVRVDDDKVAQVSAEMCNFAGPTGTHPGGSITGRAIVHTGHGGVATLIPPRPKVGVGVSIGAQSFTWAGTPIGGDSGSPVRLAGGNALGILTHGLEPTGLGIGTRLDRGADLAGVALTLSTVSYIHGQ